MATSTTATANVPPATATATATAATDVPATPGEPYDCPANRVWVKQPICTRSTDLLPLPYLVLSTTTELDAHFQSTWDIREQDEWNVSQPQTITGTPSDEPSEGEPTERSYSGRQGTCSPCELDCQCGRRRRYVRKLRPIEVRLNQYIFGAALSLICPPQVWSWNQPLLQAATAAEHRATFLLYLKTGSLGGAIYAACFRMWYDQWKIVGSD